MGSMGIITVSMAVSLLLQELTFAIVAGTMGPRQFGAFATVAALALITGLLSGLGAGAASAAPGRPGAGGATLCLGDGPRLPGAFGSASRAALHGPGSIAHRRLDFLADRAFVAISDIALARVNNIAASCYQAVGRPRGNAWLNIGFSDRPSARRLALDRRCAGP